MKRLAIYIVFMLASLIYFPTSAQVIGIGTPPLPINQGSLIPSNPIPPITTLDTAGLGLLTGIIHAVATPVDMKLLILATDGTEPGLAALQFFLDYLGTPYQVVLLANGQPLPPLDNGVKGFYQGIILTIGNLAVCNPACHSVLDANGWAALDSYTRNYHVRVASYFTFPEARYGMAFVSGMGTTDEAPALANLTSAGASVFNYLQPSATVKIASAWTYLATAVAAKGETTTPILQIGGSVAGVTHTSADGREYLALTMDNNPFLLHSATLNYGIIHWITKGLFLGSRKTYMTPQVDDHFIAADMFDGSQQPCIPVGFATDPTFVPPATCPQYRITGQDLSALGTGSRMSAPFRSSRDLRLPSRSMASARRQKAAPPGRPTAFSSQAGPSPISFSGSVTPMITKTSIATNRWPTAKCARRPRSHSPQPRSPRMSRSPSRSVCRTTPLAW